MGWVLDTQKDAMAFGLAFIQGWATERIGTTYEGSLNAAHSIRFCSLL